MKVLFVHQNLGAYGGAEANILLTASELLKRGHELALLYHKSTGKGENDWYKSFSETYRLPNESHAETVEAVLADFKPDLAYVHNLRGLGALETLLASNVPVVRMVHDHALYCMREYKYNYFTRKICTRAAGAGCVFPCLASVVRNRGGRMPVRWASLRKKKAEIELNRRCTRLVVYSEYSRQELIRNGFDAQKVHQHVPIRPRGPGCERPSSFSPRNLVLFAGQIIRGKGVDVLLEALAKVSVEFECVIAGEGSHRRHCERLRDRLGLRNRVHFCGYLAPSELEQLYLEASVFVISSLWPEPFGMVGPEAMRYGLPVVGFDAGAIREWLIDGENGFLIPWKNIPWFAAGIETLLRDKRLAAHMGKRGMDRVNRLYNPSRQVLGLEQVFSQAKGSSVVLNESVPLHVVDGHCQQ